MIPAALIPFFVLAVKGELVGLYSQCGGINWTGETECASPATCYSQNPYYYQCTTVTDTPESADTTITQTTVADTPTSAAQDSTTVQTTASQQSTLTAIPVSEETSSIAIPVSEETTAPAAPASFSSAAPSEPPVDTSTTATTEATTTETSAPVVEPTTETSSILPTTLVTKAVSKVSSSAAAASSSSSSSSSSDTITAVSGGWSGSGVTTRYWDCCKPSCAWDGKSTDITSPVQACDASGNVLTDSNVQSGCVGGTAYMCNDQSPWVVSDTLAYGFAAASIISGTEQTMCCSCVKLTFTDQLVGKEMIVQITNTGTDLSSNHFDIALPGGGVGLYTDGCSSEFGSGYSWGDQYGGVSSETECSALPTALQPGCDFRFGTWWNGADNPDVTFEQVVCPAELIAKTGCGRTDQ